jgi:hypothetical protein
MHSGMCGSFITWAMRWGMRSGPWTGHMGLDTSVDRTHATGLGKPVFSERPFGTAGHAHSGTYWHTNGGEEGMYNWVDELLKGGQR